MGGLCCWVLCVVYQVLVSVTVGLFCDTLCVGRCMWIQGHCVISVIHGVLLVFFVCVGVFLSFFVTVGV